jgi:RNA ligase (TIGR02306 family)
MRELASIQRIIKVEPIENADNLEVATVLGWKVVVKKGEFKENDLCCYVEIDSILPEKPEFEFMRSRNFKVKTIKLRGQVSQGIVFPLSILPDYICSVGEGADVTNDLGITKYEPPVPACLIGKSKGNFPNFIPKTDETRVQVLQRLLNKYQGQQFYITEKLDGSSATFYLNNDEFGVCSRNIDLIETEDNTFWKVARELDIESKLRSLGKNIAIQGELIGEGIQGNKYGLKGHTARFFNVFDIDKYEYYACDDFIVTIVHELGLETVPILDIHYKLINNIDELVTLSIDKSVLNSQVQREGIVLRPIDEKCDIAAGHALGSNGRVSFKVINPQFLLKYDE